MISARKALRHVVKNNNFASSTILEGSQIKYFYSGYLMPGLREPENFLEFLEQSSGFDSEEQ